MIQIAINGQFLEVAKGFKIPMEEAFAFDEFLSVPGEKSWKFSLPKTATNRLIFEFADVPDVVWDPATSYPCTLHIGGRLFKSGKLYIEEDSEEDFDVYFIGAIGDLKSLLNEVKIPALAWPEITGITNMFDYAEASAVDPDNYDIVFPPIASDKESIYLTDFYRYNGLKWLESTPGTFAYDGYEDSAYVNKLVPFVFVRKLWALVQTRFNITIESEFLEHPEINNLIFAHTNIINLFDVNGEYTNTFNSSIETVNYVPDITIESFIVEFCKLFNLYATYDNVSRVFRFIKRNDLTELPRVVLPNTVSKITTKFNAQKTLSLRYDYNTDDVAVVGVAVSGSGNQMVGVDGPDGSTVVESKISTWPMSLRTISGAWLAPTTSDIDNEKVSLRLLFYRGIKFFSTNTFKDYRRGPHAGSINDSTYDTEYSLMWRGDNNIKAVQWQHYEDYILKGRTFVLKMVLTDSFLLAFDPLKVYVINGMKCLIKKMSYDLGSRDIDAEIEVLKI